MAFQSERGQSVKGHFFEDRASCVIRCKGLVLESLPVAWLGLRAEPLPMVCTSGIKYPRTLSNAESGGARGQSDRP